VKDRSKGSQARLVSSDGELKLLAPAVGTAPCVPAIRNAVDSWAKGGYRTPEGCTETSKVLLNFWFHSDHRLPNGRAFKYNTAQQEAMETLVYLYEVAKVRRQKAMLEKYAVESKHLALLQHDDFARYCFKMATGSGKTKVMALAVAWQYFNATMENIPGYSKTALLIAPNVIVFERLQLDFGGGTIFRRDPVIPPELMNTWDFECYMRGEAERARSEGAFYLTNIQQLYERPAEDNDEPKEITDVLGHVPNSDVSEVEGFLPRLIRRNGPILLVNDEAHHTHDEELKWNDFIRDLNSKVTGGVGAQLDFTATPRFSTGELFTWTIYDYPLKRAIQDGVVKRPLKGVASEIHEARSDIASRKYGAYLTAGVERWKEYGEQLKPLRKKPILFVMMNSTDDADEVADYLQKHYPQEFGEDRLLVIHTDKKGEVTKRELASARLAAREVDLETSPINAIVSVLMLREGWDVQNVTVVVGLRPYTSKANILPEQTVGRGLRLMFRELPGEYVERVDVIGNKAFINFVEDLEREEGTKFDTFQLGKEKLEIVTIMVDPKKEDMDIEIPLLSPILVRKKSLSEEISSLDVHSLECPKLPKKETGADIETFRYEGFDFLTLQKMIERRYKIPQAQTAEEVISYYAKEIANDVKLPSQFAYLVPKIRQFLKERAFGEDVNLDDPIILKAIGSNVSQYVVVQTFVKALRAIIVEERIPEIVGPPRKLSQTEPFAYSKPTYRASKCIFNRVPCDNEFEVEFAKFLQSTREVAKFSKLPSRFGFSIEYTDTVANLRYYEPDFVAILDGGDRYLIETKGREDPDVPHKDRAAKLWCEYASDLIGVRWQYLKVRQKEFERLQPNEFSDLSVFKYEQQTLTASEEKEAKPLVSREERVEDYVKKGESASLEFKSALSWDYKLGKQSKEIENATTKTLCAFMNSEGGTLAIGVDDKGQVLGVEKDFSLLSKSNKDGFEQKLIGLASSCLGKENVTYVHLSWQAVEGKTVAVVNVDKSKRPVYVDLQGKSEFYIRTGNISQPLDVREATAYIRDHWPKI
jgi:type III restriction enzyme